jgi:hypothetical protein
MAEPITGIKEGLVEGPELDGDSCSLIDIPSGATSLIDLTKDFHLFTPALLHLTVPLTVDPFDSFVAERGSPMPRYSFQFEKPIFRGLTHPCGDPLWNYVLFALPHENWAEWIGWVGTVAYNDPKRGLFRRIRTQEINLWDPLDPIASKIPSGTPNTVQVTVLAIESNKGSFYMLPDPRMPTATHNASMVFSDTEAFAKALKDGNDPYTEVNKGETG